MQLIPQYINEPKPGKTNWSIKGMDGVYYSCKPELAGHFQLNIPSEVEISVKDFNGKDCTFIESVSGGVSTVPAPQAPKPPNTSVAPATDPVPANIWICGIVNQAVSSGVHDPAKAYQWAVDNYANFRDRRPVTAFPGYAALTPAPPRQEMVDALAEDVLNDPIPF